MTGWIPSGLFFDLIDNNIALHTEFNSNSEPLDNLSEPSNGILGASVTDNVEGFTIAMLFEALNHNAPTGPFQHCQSLLDLYSNIDDINQIETLYSNYNYGN